VQTIPQIRAIVFREWHQNFKLTFTPLFSSAEARFRGENRPYLHRRN
jgi:hypothetical protein